MTIRERAVDTRPLLERAIQIALAAHSDQADKAGEPYILHPLRVMLSMQTADERVVAILHDVIEDSPITADYLLEAGFTPRKVDAIKALTRVGAESYDAFIERVATNSLAVNVKLADIADNMSEARAASRPDRLTERYRKAYAMLRQAAGRGAQDG